MRRRLFWTLGIGLTCMLVAMTTPRAEETIKVAFIEPFSGSFAEIGDADLKDYNFILSHINEKGGALGHKFELVTFDSKLQPAEASIALKLATDRDIGFILTCAGSNVAAALIDGVSKHNARNPDRRVLFLNCGALAKELTNEHCNFWHFRFAANTEQRAEIMVRTLPKDQKSIYLINPDYLAGQSLRRETLMYLAQHRPDIKVVGDDLVPLGQVKDFTPYIVKVKASGAQGLITGNAGPDLSLLMHAGADAGLDIQYYTYLGYLAGGPAAISAAGDNRTHTITEFHPNVPVEMHNQDAESFVQDFRKEHSYDFVDLNGYVMFAMLADAINKAGSADALKVALLLEDMHGKDMMGNDYWMRKDDHQFMLPYYASRFVKDVKYDSEKTGMGWQTETMVKADKLAQPTDCKMERPAS
jgi:branched-chain amino acid transport system substrate-binding protein